MGISKKVCLKYSGVGIPAISKHLSNIFNDGELDKEVVISKMETTTRHHILKDNGRISHTKALEKAYSEYEIFNKT